MNGVLIHHGILGQKWGVRRFQNEDGSLTSAGKQRYAGEGRGDDVVIRKGAKLGHVSVSKKITLKDDKLYLYDKNNDTDRAIYEGAYAAFNTGRAPDGQVYKHTYRATQDLRSPSETRRKEIFQELYKKNPKLFNQDLKQVEDMLKSASQNGSLIPEYDKFIRKYANGKTTKLKGDWGSKDGNADYAYTLFNVDTNMGSKSVQMYMDKVRKLGYNALIDDNNRGIYNGAEKPFIALYARQSLKEVGKAKKMSYGEIRKNYRTVGQNNRKRTGSGEVYMSGIIAHHGIFGMKWGVRRFQNEDGSLTPAGKERYCQKGTHGEFAGQSRDNDIRIKAGTKAYRVQSTDKFGSSGQAYIALDRMDNIKYLEQGVLEPYDTGIAADCTWDDKDINGGRPFNVTVKFEKDIIMPSYEKSIDTFIKTVSAQAKRSGGLNRVAEIIGPADEQKQKEFVSNFKRMQVEECRDKAYVAFMGAMLRDSFMRDEFFDSLKKQGYNAIIDEFDANFGKGLTKTPVIMFDRSDAKQIKAQAVTKQDYEDISRYVGEGYKSAKEFVYKSGNLDRIARFEATDGKAAERLNRRFGFEK